MPMAVISTVNLGRERSGLIGQFFNRHSKYGTDNHGGQHDQDSVDDGRIPDQAGYNRGGVVADEGPDHEDIAVGKIDKAQDAIDHRIAERNQGINTAERDTVYDLLQQFTHE